MTGRTIAIAATNISLACLPMIDPAFMVGSIGGADVAITTSDASVWIELGFDPRYLVRDAEHARVTAVKLTSVRCRLAFDEEMIVDRISQCEPIAGLYYGTTRRLLLGNILTRMAGEMRAVGLAESGPNSEASAIREIAAHIKSTIERETALEDHIQYQIAAA